MESDNKNTMSSVFDKQHNVVSSDKPALIEKRATKTSRGILSKGWYKVGSKTVLAKGNTEGNREPFAEVVGGRIAHYMSEGYAMVYEIAPASDYPELKVFDFEHVSVCEKYASKGSQQFSKYLDALHGKELQGNAYLDWIKKQPLSYRQKLCQMLFIDAVIGNQDRHLNNWDIEIATGDILPFIDFGAGCLGWGKLSSLSYKSPESISPDKAKPFGNNHLQQIRHLRLILKDDGKIRVNDPEIAVKIALAQSDDVLTVNSVYAEKVTQYLTNRARVFKDKAKDILEVV